MIEEYCPCCCSKNFSTPKVIFGEYVCVDCDHSWYSASAFDVGIDIYEKSQKYLDYYIGQAPEMWYHDKAVEYLKANCQNSRILDFGCFDGFFTSRLVQLGFDAYGCDWNSRAIETGRHKYNLRNRLSLAPTGEFDVIVALEVIEHFTDPNEFIDQAKFHLKAGGILILSCPNRNSFYRPHTDAPPHHFSRFSLNSLATLLVRSGFHVCHQDREMSTFQFIRNLLGDIVRRDKFELESVDEFAITGNRIKKLKTISNYISGACNFMFTPIDAIAHKLGLSYLSQFVIAKLDE